MKSPFIQEIFMILEEKCMGERNYIQNCLNKHFSSIFIIKLYRKDIKFQKTYELKN